MMGYRSHNAQAVINHLFQPEFILFHQEATIAVFQLKANVVLCQLIKNHRSATITLKIRHR
jgi:hypothetical protein